MQAEKEEPMWMVVGFEVMPCSIKREKGDKVEHVKCAPYGDPSNPEPQRVSEGADIIYT
jgi:transmembrane 9 superfamily member 2/4